MMMKTIVALGIGNRLMRDDGIGVCVVEHLVKQDFEGNFYFVVGETDVDYCLDAAAEYEYVVIIDAVITGKDPGHITVLPLKKVLGSFTGEISLHNRRFIACVSDMNKINNGILIGIEPSEIECFLGLSPDLNNKLPDILDIVKKTLKEFELQVNGEVNNTT